MLILMITYGVTFEFFLLKVGVEHGARAPTVHHCLLISSLEKETQTK